MSMKRISARLVTRRTLRVAKGCWWAVTLCLVGLGAMGLGGCGGSLYALKATSASQKLETARALGAETYAPYEYFYAKEHLDKAAEEAGTADYGDAVNLADVADEYADKAIDLARGAHEGAGR